MNFFKKKINELTLSNLFLFYLFSLVFFIIFAYFYLETYIYKFPSYIDENKDIVLKELPFDLGNLLHNLYYKNEYVQKVNPFEINFHLARLPFYPFLLLVLAKINLNFYFIFFMKNILSFSVIFFSIYYFLKDLKKEFIYFIILLIIYWYNPYNTHVLLALSFSDTLVSVFFPLIFLFVNSRNFYLNFFFGLFIFCLYLLKPSIWFFCLIFPFIILILNYVKFKKKYLITNLFSILFLLIAIFSWGLYGLNKSNYFPFGSSSNSTNTFFLTSVLNKDFNTHYPILSTDLLLNTEFSKNIKFENEKDVYIFFKKKNLEFFKDNSVYYLNGIIKKLKFIFFGINKDGRYKDDFEKNGNEIRYSNFPNKIIMNIALIYAFFSIVKSIKNKKKFPYIDLIFLSMFCLYLAPHIIAWATSKHLVSIFILSKIYIFTKIFKCSKF